MTIERPNGEGASCRAGIGYIHMFSVTTAGIFRLRWPLRRWLLHIFCFVQRLENRQGVPKGALSRNGIRQSRLVARKHGVGLLSISLTSTLIFPVFPKS